MDTQLEILFEDNHLLALNKKPGEISQGDKTGDTPLVDQVALYLKEKYGKPGNVYVALLHRIDRPVSGVLLFAKTSKAAERLSADIKTREFKKIYWAIVQKSPPELSGTLTHYLKKNPHLNKSFPVDPHQEGARKAVLHYRLLASLQKYHVLEITLETGRHHQIRAQLAAIGCPIRGDLKYGYPRSNPNGSIHLHARSITFLHPVKKEPVTILADPPKDVLWDAVLRRNGE